MFGLFSEKEKILKYTPKNLEKDIDYLIKVFLRRVENIDLSELNESDVNFIKDNIKTVPQAIKDNYVFLVLYKSDLNELEDYNEGHSAQERKVPITNIEDFSSRVEKVIIKNLSERYKQNFNYILNKVNGVLTDSYFEFVETKRKQLYTFKNQKKTLVKFPYFGSLYRIKSLYNNIEVEKGIKLGNYHKNIAKLHDREGAASMHKVFADVINDFLENKDYVLTPELITSMTFSSKNFINKINSDYITLNKNNLNSKNILSIDDCLANRYLPVFNAPEKVTDAKTNEETTINQAYIFTTLDTILTRYRGNNGNRVDELGNSLSHFGNMVETYDDTFLHKRYIIISDEDWKKFYDYINTSDDFLSDLVNPKVKKNRLLEEADLGTGEAKKEFDELLLKAIILGCTDIHLKVFEGNGLVNMRTNTGVIKDEATIPKDRLIRIVRMLSGDSKVNEFGMEMPQDGEQHRTIIDPKNKTKYEVDLRFGFAQGLERVYIRLGAVTSDGKRKKLSLLELGYEETDLEMINGMCDNNSNGLILVTGPTGSGKTTLLYGILEQQLAKRDDVHLLTAEDPIERVLKFKNVEQNKITEKANSLVLLKSFLRQDPDWILIGETRDKGLLSMVIEASQTGHLTFSTYHTNNTIETLDRLSKMYGGDDVQSFGLARDSLLSVLRGIVSVILVPKLCPHCKQEATYDDVYKRIKKKGIDSDKIESIIDKKGTFNKRNPKGCSHCDLGFKGKQTISEIMNLTDHKVFEQVKKRDYSGITKQFEKGMKYVNEGLIDIDTLAKNASR